MLHSSRKLPRLEQIRPYFAAAEGNLNPHQSKQTKIILSNFTYRTEELKKQDHITQSSDMGYFTGFAGTFPLINVNLL